MENKFQFDYYYGVEAEQFSFYRVPRALIKDNRFKDLSSDAKLLYGLMLDRMAMSMKNGWIDVENRVYIIYKLENIMKDLNCGKDKGVKILAELDTNKGVGLIERKKRGLGKPSIIYVKNFITCETQEQNIAENENNVKREEKSEEVQSSEKPKSEDDVCHSPEFGKAEILISDRSKSTKNEQRSPEFGKTEVLTSEMQNSKVRKNRSLEFGKTDTNYNNINYIDLNYIDNNINQINPSTKEEQEPNLDNDVIDMIDQANIYMQIIKKNIEYDHYMQYADWGEKQIVEDLYQIICDVVCIKRINIKIGKEDYPYELVKSKFLKLTSSHIQYVMECMKKVTTKVTNIRSYLITALYNAAITMNSYYQQEVQHDMYGGGWNEKKIL